IEQWSSGRKVQLRGALDGVQASKYADATSPLLKFHGCMNLDPERTLWTHGQLDLPAIKERVESCIGWMNLNLPQRDLLVVGFWTDWGYFNDVLAPILSENTLSSITVIDPQPTDVLKKKAPLLWDILSSSPQFEHVVGSGNEVLPEIRKAYSRVWVRKLYYLGAPLMAGQGGAIPSVEEIDASELDVTALYDLRRDAEGRPMNRAARDWAPSASAAQTGLAHLLVSAAADERRGSWYVKAGQTIRIVHGAGEGLTTVKERFKEPPTAPQADVVICAGAVEQGVPGSIMGKGLPAGIVRPKSGSGSRWITLEAAKVELML
ncbi:MAG: SIR2 family protein, partial [Alphaproteobacteria bacterium]|nr:SIR2 family protein [Alphaproteobacteria bacterium]